MDLFKRFATGKSRRRSRQKAGSGKRKSRPRTGGRSGGRFWGVLLAGAGLVVVLGTGLLNWAHSRHGQATLLTLGVDTNYDDVQAAVDAALVRALPGYDGGRAVAPTDHDWPAPEYGAGALIRCRLVTVPPDETWWEVQARIAGVVAPTGARILWGERLFPDRPGPGQVRPDEERDALRLDIGVVGRPTHTLVLTRAGSRTGLQWGGGPGLSRWREFAGQDGPVVALIIDDWGHGKTAAAMDLLRLPAPLTMAVLPDLPYSRFFSLQRTDLVLPPGHDAGEVPGAAIASGRPGRLAAGCPVEVSVGARREAWPVPRREVILHLPMEPQDYPATNPGPDAILVGMRPDEIETRLDRALATLTSVTGVNNHMGSAATSDQPTMRALMEVLRDRDLIFIDSLTTSRSVAYAEAVRAGIPSARNRIFLDYDNEDEAKIAANLARLVKSARTAGTAVGIGHPHPATAAVLAREVPRLVREGVRFVTISELLALRELPTAVTADKRGR